VRSVYCTVHTDSLYKTLTYHLQRLKYKVRLKTLIPLYLRQPTDRLKSEEELVREEKEKLEKLEMERLQRMHGFKEDLVPERQHRSADDLDDGFVFNMYEFHI